MEIERKFLVDLSLLAKYNKTNGSIIQVIRMEQGYLSNTDTATARVRQTGTQGFITVKSRAIGISREEYEYEIPYEDAKAMLKLCPKTLKKSRYVIQHDGLSWEVDYFRGDNKGLVVAEIELESEDQKIKLPEWVTEEVSFDHRYSNNNLIDNPYKEW